MYRVCASPGLDLVLDHTRKLQYTFKDFKNVNMLYNSLQIIIKVRFYLENFCKKDEKLNYYDHEIIALALIFLCLIEF